MHFYNFNIKDYASHTAHLEPLEDLAYRRMLDWCYLHESPLPENVEEIARNIRMREHCKCIASVLQEFFTLTENGYENRHAKKVIAEMQKLSGKRSKAAKRRWANNGKGSKGDASALQLECKSNATHNLKPITHNPEKEISQVESSERNSMQNARAQTREGEISLLLRSRGCRRINPGMPIIAQWSKTGYSDDELHAALGSAESRGKSLVDLPANYLDKILAGNRQDAQNSIRAGPSVAEKTAANMQKWLEGDY